LVSNETFRSLGQLALDYPDISIINGVICVDNKDQLEKRYITTTTNNTNALIALINEKSSKT
jgi:Riboflavin synthase beta-chain